MSQQSKPCSDKVKEEGIRKNVTTLHSYVVTYYEQKAEKVCRNISQLYRDKERGKCQQNIVATFGTMPPQKISRNLEETLELCRDISIDCRDKTKGRAKKECRDIAKFVAIKVGGSSQNFVTIIAFMSLQNLPR